MPAPSPYLSRKPRVCSVLPPPGPGAFPDMVSDASAVSTAAADAPHAAVPEIDRDAVGAGLLVSLAGCGFGGAPCVGLKIREENRDVRIRRARFGFSQGVAGAPPRLADEANDPAHAGDQSFGTTSRIVLFGVGAAACAVCTAISSAAGPR